MKYIYMICLTLSSFFILKNISANEPNQQYAFFIPNNAFQQNTTVNDLDSMRPRYAETDVEEYEEENDEDEDKYDTYAEENYNNEYEETNNQDSAEVMTETQDNLSQQANKEQPSDKKDYIPQNKLPYVREKVESIQIKQLKKTSSELINQASPDKESSITEEASLQSIPPSKIMSEDIKEKLKKYSLDDEEAASETKENELPPLEKFKQKSLNEMLATLPYPDRSKPKFKQIYATYGAELRVLYNNHKLPINREQEKTLSKASGSGRFTVE